MSWAPHALPRWTAILAITLAAAALPLAARAESLADAIALAYQTNPTLLAARADLRALDERYIQAQAALGPTAGVTEQHTLDNANVQQPGIPGLELPSTVYNRAVTDTASLTINQPIYDNGALSTAVAAARADVMSGRQSLRQQETVVLNQVITAYADVLLAQNLLAVARQDVEILRQQLAETQAKVDVKQNTLTDRAQARARLTAAQVKLIQAGDGLSDAQARYLAAVGEQPGQLDPLPDLPGVPPDVEAAFNAADRANPQLLGAAYTELASRARIAQAKAADGLQVSLSFGASQQPEALNIENNNLQSLTASVVVNKPLFTSGAHASRLRQAIETNNRDDLRLSAQRRQVIVTVAQAWNDLAARRQQLLGLRDQLADEETAFRGSRIEERIGLRSTIDVLNAEQEFQATKVAVMQGYHDEYLNRVALLGAMGLLQAELLEPQIPPYRPEASLNRHNQLASALPWEALVAMIDSIGAPRVASEPTPVDTLGAERPASASDMPSAPKWSDLAHYLTDNPGGQ